MLLKTIATYKTQFILHSKNCSNNANLVLRCDSYILFITKIAFMIYNFLDNLFYVKKNSNVSFKKC